MEDGEVDIADIPEIGGTEAVDIIAPTTDTAVMGRAIMAVMGM